MYCFPSKLDFQNILFIVSISTHDMRQDYKEFFGLNFDFTEVYFPEQLTDFRAVYFRYILDCSIYPSTSD